MASPVLDKLSGGTKSKYFLTRLYLSCGDSDICTSGRYSECFVVSFLCIAALLEDNIVRIDETASIQNQRNGVIKARKIYVPT